MLIHFGEDKAKSILFNKEKNLPGKDSFCDIMYSWRIVRLVLQKRRDIQKW